MNKTIKKIRSSIDINIDKDETTFKKFQPKIKRIPDTERERLLKDFNEFRDQVHQDVVNSLVYHR